MKPSRSKRRPTIAGGSPRKANRRWSSRIDSYGRSVTTADREFAVAFRKASSIEEYAVICGGPDVSDARRRARSPARSPPQHARRSGPNQPPAWDPLPIATPITYWAKDFDTLMDSPIAAGNLTIQTFSVDGSRHHLVDIGNAIDLVNWDGSRKIADLEKMVQETRNFWGFLPFDDYYFLNKVTSRRRWRARTFELDADPHRPARAPVERRGTPPPLDEFRRPRILPHLQRQTTAADRTRPVRLRTRPPHQRPVGRAKA